MLRGCATGRPKETTVRNDEAEMIAIRALGWLAADEELLPVFLGATGVSTDDLRKGATEPEFLGSVLDFVTMDDAWVVKFCDAASLPYETPMIARQALRGGSDTHWT